jgi:hypothetical protein
MSYQHLLFIIIFVIFLLVVPFIAKAQLGGCPPEAPPGSICIPNPLQYETIPEVIAAITQLLKTIVIPLGSVMLIISGIQYLTSAGNEERVTRAKKTMFYTIIGMAVVIAVDLIVDVIKEVLIGE